MNIVGIAQSMLRVPRKAPFRNALRPVTAVEDIVVMNRTDTGHGSAPPTALITGRTHGSIVAAITGAIAPRLVGLNR